MNPLPRGTNDPAGARSTRWRAAIRAEDQLAVVDAQIEAAGLDTPTSRRRGLERERARLQAEHARLLALDGLCWALTPAAHAEALAALERADAALVALSEPAEPEAAPARHVTVECSWCGSEFQAAQPTDRFCAPACRNDAMRATRDPVESF